MKNIIFFWTYFFSHLGSRMYSVYILVIVAGLFEIMGIIVLFPILSTIIDGNFGDLGVFNFFLDFLIRISPFESKQLSLIIFLVIFFIFKGAITYSNLSYVSWLRGLLVREVKRDLIINVKDTTLEHVQDKGAGYYSNLINEQVNRLSQAFYCFSQLAIVAINLMFYVALTLLISPRVLFVLGLMSISVALIFRLINRNISHFSTRTSELNSEISEELIQFIRLQKYWKATNTHDFFINKIYSQIVKISNIQYKIGRLSALSVSIKDPISVGILLTMISYQVQSLNQAVSFSLILLGIVYKLSNSAFASQTWWQGLLEFRGSIEVLNEERKLLRENKEPVLNDYYLSEIGDIKLRDVGFSFEAGKPVLSDINVTFKKNTTTAIVGESGSGKSSLLALLSTTAPPTTGLISIDDVGLDKIALKSIRSKISFITQDSPIFSGTLLENIALTNVVPDAELNKIAEILEILDLQNFINALSNGVNTDLGHAGVKLSGGQKQKICFARELYRNTELLILDEATSALDPLSDQNFRTIINRFRGLKTIIIVTHRVDTVREVDNILVMGAGKIVEHGTYEELTENGNSKFSKLSETV